MPSTSFWEKQSELSCFRALKGNVAHASNIHKNKMLSQVNVEAEKHHLLPKRQQSHDTTGGTINRKMVQKGVRGEMVPTNLGHFWSPYGDISKTKTKLIQH